MKRTKDELITNAKALIGDADDAITFLEDLADSVEAVDTSALENRITELETANAELDKSWREKYISRFGDVTPQPTTDNTDVIDETDDEVIIPSVDEIAEKF